jgi:hypothetical protein
MSSILQSFYSFFTERFVQTSKTLYERTMHTELIETINEVGEKRYIEIPTNNYNSRREKLQILLKKSQSLFNFCLKSKKNDDDDDDDEDMSYELVNLIERVRMSLYRNDDITPLFAQYEEIKRYYKKGSMSTVNLSMG